MVSPARVPDPQDTGREATRLCSALWEQPGAAGQLPLRLPSLPGVLSWGSSVYSLGHVCQDGLLGSDCFIWGSLAPGPLSGVPVPLQHAHQYFVSTSFPSGLSGSVALTLNILPLP